MKKTILFASLAIFASCTEDKKSEDQELLDKKTTKNIAESVLANYFVHEKSYEPKEDLSKLDVNLASDIFYDNLSKIFLKLKDAHTIFVKPTEYSREYGILPENLSFQLVNDAQGNKRIVVSKIDIEKYKEKIKNIEYFRFLEEFQVGDIITKINGKESLEVLKETYPLSKGANEDAQNYFGLPHLMFRKFPLSAKADFDLLQVEILRNNESRTIHVASTEIIRANRNFDSHFKSSKNELKTPKIENLKLDFMIRGEKSKNKDKEDNIYHYLSNVIKNNKNYLVIKIPTFYIDINKDYENIIMDILSKISSELNLQDYDGVLIDVRDNPGGFIIYSDVMAKLFYSSSSSHEFSPMSFRMKITNKIKLLVDNLYLSFPNNSNYMSKFKNEIDAGLVNGKVSSQ